MSKLNNLNPREVLSVFSVALGDSFDKIVNDVASMLGRITDKEIIAKHGEWKAGAKFKLTSKEGYSVQLPPNNPATILLCFGMRLGELAHNGQFDVQADIPKMCVDWVAQHRKTTAEPTLATVKK